MILVQKIYTIWNEKNEVEFQNIIMSHKKQNFAIKTKFFIEIFGWFLLIVIRSTKVKGCSQPCS